MGGGGGGGNQQLHRPPTEPTMRCRDNGKRGGAHTHLLQICGAFHARLGNNDVSRPGVNQLVQQAPRAVVAPRGALVVPPLVEQGTDLVLPFVAAGTLHPRLVHAVVVLRLLDGRQGNLTPFHLHRLRQRLVARRAPLHPGTQQQQAKAAREPYVSTCTQKGAHTHAHVRGKQRSSEVCVCECGRKWGRTWKRLFSLV
jgi:hypothetical protein